MYYLAKYQTHSTVNELNKSVRGHINQAKLTGNKLKVLMCLAKHSLKYAGACHIKVITIANELCISRSTVTRCIKKLKDLNIINVINQEKLNGIKGANIYSINSLHVFEPSNEPSNESSEMSHRMEAEKPYVSRIKGSNQELESFSFNPSFNPFVDKNVTTYYQSVSLKESLRTIYNPNSIKENESFEELFKIAIGRLKQFMKSHNMNYLQMEQIIIRCMQQLVVKRNVRNQFAMYSNMIERQVLQLFEPQLGTKIIQSHRSEIVPAWFKNRNESQVDEKDLTIDFEEERVKYLAKLK